MTHVAQPMGGWARREWPDGRHALVQPMIAVSAFNIVLAAVTAYQESSNGGS